MLRPLVGLALGFVLFVPNFSPADGSSPCPPVVITAACPPLPCITPPIGCPPGVSQVAPSTPTVVPERMKETPKVEEKKSEPMASVKVEPTAPKTEMAKPREAEAEQKPEVKPEVKPAANIESKIPALDLLPTKPEPTATPKTDLPKFDLNLPDISETPKPAAKEIKPVVDLPKFDIPLPGAVAPAQPVEANKKSISNSSPMAAEREASFDRYPVDGPAPDSPTAKRAVGFINKSNRDLLLTVDGQSIVLPAKNLIRAELPASFVWQLGGEKERTERLAATSPGVDIVIRK